MSFNLGGFLIFNTFCDLLDDATRPKYTNNSHIGSHTSIKTNKSLGKPKQYYSRLPFQAPDSYYVSIIIVQLLTIFAVAWVLSHLFFYFF